MPNSPTVTLKRLLTSAPDSLFYRQRSRGKSLWFMSFNLLWLMWLLGDLLTNPHLGRWFVPVTVITLAVFLPLYAFVYIRPMRETLAYVLAMAALGYLTMPFNGSGGTTYIIFSCAMLVFQGAPRRTSELTACVVAAFVLEAVLLHWPWQVTVMMMMICVAVAGGNMAYWVNFQKDAELRLSHDEVRKLAATAERERIGRDLHDLLGHTLSLITLKLELSRKLFDQDPDAARREITEAEKVARHALGEVRSAVTGIRATDLAAEFASARLLLESSGVRLEYRLPAPVPVEIERDLSLILREAATNIARHARATTVRVELTHEGDDVFLRIVDNGRGGVAADGNGLAGMRERARAMGGDLQIDSPLRRGTTVCVRVPLPARDAVPTITTSAVPPSRDAQSIPTTLAGDSA